MRINIKSDVKTDRYVPCVHRWVNITKVPFIGWNLAVRLHVPFPREKQQLALGVCRIDNSKRDTVEGRVPCCEEWIFPPIKKYNQSVLNSKER
jgi:hypothetical protein